MPANLSFPDEESDDQRRQLLYRMRLAAVQRLVALDKPPRAIIEREAEALAVSSQILYKWLRRYRADPGLDAVLPRKRGRKTGHHALTSGVEAVIEAVLTEAPELWRAGRRPRIAEIHQRVSDRCRAAGWDVPDIKTVSRRLRVKADQPLGPAAFLRRV